MKNFRDLAKEATSRSFITVNREAIKTDLLIAAYPDGVTIVGADILETTENGATKTYAACIFAENDKQYFNGGKALTEIVSAWLDGYENAEAMSADLKASGGVKVKLSKKLTKDGRTFTEVTVV